MARRDYGFVRSYASLGSDLDDLKALIASGYAGALFDYNDPQLAQAVHDAQAAGIPFGFWGDPNAVGNNDNAYVARMAQLYAQYKPEILVPDLEFAYRGDPGSAQWNKMANLAKLWKQYLPNARTAIAPMGSEWGMGNYNVGAWGPNTEWLPQAYGANSHTEWMDPNKVVQSLIRAGVRPEMISPILADAHYQQGAYGGYGGSSLWTVDDFIGRPIPKASGPARQPQNTGGPAAPTTSTTRVKPVLNFLGAGASQGPERIANQGLQWFGQNFGNQQAFAKALQQRGQSYAEWARQHQPAAQALQARSR